MSSAPHIPVLGRESVDLLAPRAGGIYVDATFGAGGYSRAILDVPGTRLIAIDRDRTAIAGGAELVERSDGRLTLVEDRFSNLDQVARDCGHDSVDGIVLDVGVSSMQLDQAARGFSFRLDGPHVEECLRLLLHANGRVYRKRPARGNDGRRARRRRKCAAIAAAAKTSAADGSGTCASAAARSCRKSALAPGTESAGSAVL